MIIKNFGMIAADTTRSKAYLQAMARHALLPESIYILPNENSVLLPGQSKPEEKKYISGAFGSEDSDWTEAHFNQAESLSDTAARANVPMVRLPASNINAADVVNFIRATPQEIMLYSGYGGVLLRKEVLDSGKRFLHVHGGYLPDYKGSTTNYYSLLAEKNMGASSLFLSEVIDSGPVLLRRKFPAPPDASQMDHVYDNAARAKVLIETLTRHVHTGHWNCDDLREMGGETYYVIHPLLKHIAILAH